MTFTLSKQKRLAPIMVQASLFLIRAKRYSFYIFCSPFAKALFTFCLGLR